MTKTIIKKGVVETVIWEIPLIRIQVASSLQTLTCSQYPKTILIKSKTPDPKIGHVNDEMWTKIIDKMGVVLTLIWEIPHLKYQNTQMANFDLFSVP